ncbi:MAG TPA: flagellar protein export ATPase FliI [Vitreimonas sp.]|uniref:flagellar protein export ATPase FliI n=1 Tax=Vitreimonas sp. TaxID=3069702 RepID=UPI002D26DEE9|nr:flagellar protein export ATPase FliI [Vitreimonas sp.]HYD87770.1 flagellar protein export ATPase FliI [Vitreimonas sp.]
MPSLLSRLANEIDALDPRRFEGRVTGLSGALVEVSGPIEALALGARATAHGHRPTRGEIVGFRGDRALLAPYDSIEAIRPGARVELEGQAPMARPSRAWLGRVIDCFGNPVDGEGPLAQGLAPRLVRAAPPSAHDRARVGGRLDVGVRAINAFAAICRGQRMGVFAGSGVGKSVLMSMLARGAQADVIVIGLVGERGREVKEFIEDTLGEEGRRRSVVVVATSDESAARRRLAPHMASAVAEHFRDEGLDVLLLIDSVTRFAMAQREIGLSVGEPPTTKGYTPSVFAELPKLLERAGPGREGSPGSITALFTVLVDGDDHNEPIADAVRGILDGHIVMERAIAERGRYPAINVLKSISRLMPMCHAAEENVLVAKARQALSLYAEMEELIRIGAYKPGADLEVDEAVRVRPALEAFLTQSRDDRTSLKDGFAMLAEALQ